MLYVGLTEVKIIQKVNYYILQYWAMLEVWWTQEGMNMSEEKVRKEFGNSYRVAPVLLIVVELLLYRFLL